MEIDWYRVNEVKKGNHVDVEKNGSENRSLRNTVAGCAGWYGMGLNGYRCGVPYN